MRRCRSARTCRPSASWSLVMVIRRRVASGRTRLTTCVTTSSTGTGSGDSDSCPTSIRAMSSTSLIRSSRCPPPRRICCTPSVWSGVRVSICRICAKPRIAFSGVRRSWLIRDRKSLFARLARSVSSCARRSRSVAARCSVMSIDSPSSDARTSSRSARHASRLRCAAARSSVRCRRSRSSDSTCGLLIAGIPFLLLVVTPSIPSGRRPPGHPAVQPQHTRCHRMTATNRHGIAGRGNVWWWRAKPSYRPGRGLPIRICPTSEKNA